MPLSEVDRQFLIKLKEQGYNQDQAVAELKKVKFEMQSPTVAAVLPTIAKASERAGLPLAQAEAMKKQRAEQTIPGGSMERENLLNKGIEQIKSQGIQEGTPEYEQATSSLKQSIASSVPKYEGGQITQGEIDKPNFIERAVDAGEASLDKRLGAIDDARKALQEGKITEAEFGRTFLLNFGGAFVSAPVAVGADLASPILEPVGEAINKSGEIFNTASTPLQYGLEKTIDFAGGQGTTQEIQQASAEQLAKLEDKYNTDAAFRSRVKTALNTAETGLDLAGLIGTAKLAQQGIKSAPAIKEAGKDLVAKGVQTAENLAPKIQRAGAALKELPQSLANKLGVSRDAKQVKALTQIESRVDEFIKNKQSLTRKVDFYKTKKNTDVQKYISDPQVFKGIKVEDGAVVVDDAVETVQSRIDRAMDAKKTTLPLADQYVGPVSKMELRDRAVQNIKNQKFSLALEKKKIDAMDREIELLPQELKLVDLDDQRARFRQSGVDVRGVQKSDSAYTALSNAARDLIFEKTDSLPVGIGNEFGQLNTYIKDMINTREFLEKTLKSQKVKGGRLTGLINKGVGAVVGSPGGVLGGIVGYELAGVISNIMMNNQLGNTLKRQFIKKLLPDDPASIQLAEELIKELEKYQPLALPSPTSEFRAVQTNSAPIELPKQSPSSIEAQEMQRLSSQPVY